MSRQTHRDRAIALLQECGRPLKVSDFADHGLNRLILSRLATAGVIERVGSGVYRLPEFTSAYADWAALALRFPDAVVCTLSAAVFHGTTQEMPSAIHVAVPAEQGRRMASAHFPVQVSIHSWRAARFPEAFKLGIEEHLIDNVPVRITDPERTLVDMFRYSSANKAQPVDKAHADTETFLDCLRRTISRPDFRVSRLDRYVEAAGVSREIRPYLQTAMYAMADAPDDNPGL